MCLGKQYSCLVWQVHLPTVKMMVSTSIFNSPAVIYSSLEVSGYSIITGRALADSIWEPNSGEILGEFWVWDTFGEWASPLCGGIPYLSPGLFLLAISGSPDRDKMPPQPRRYKNIKAKEASSSTSPHATPSRGIRNLVQSVCQFKEHFPATIKEEFEEVEVEARVTRNCIPDEEVLKDFEALLPNL